MKQKLKSLDILKGIGILMIIAVHNRHFIISDTSGIRGLINYGQMGCQLFFMVSGMALCFSWYSDRSAFIRRRYLRLAPGYLIIMCINYILNVILIDLFNYSPGFIMNRKPAAIITNILFLHGLFPDYINNVFPGGWYIGTTFILYLLFPLLIKIFEKLYTVKKNSITIIPVILLLTCMAAIKLIIILSDGALYLSNNSFLYYLFLNQLPCFSLGIMLYFQEKSDFSVKCPLYISVISFIITSVMSIYLFMHNFSGITCCITPFAAGLSFYWLAVCFIHIEKSGRQAIFTVSINFLSKCGKNSYSMYLVHSFVCWYGMKAFITWLTEKGYEYNDLTLYIIMYIPSVIAVYLLAAIFSGKKLQLKKLH